MIRQLRPVGERALLDHEPQGHRRILSIQRCGHAVERACEDRMTGTSGPL